ncbi:MAG: hypothetical protein J5509_07670 [Lachnospiraceae bacterium]|nr:hypothetical protein [Lachnospiraceae bacterium]
MRERSVMNSETYVECLVSRKPSPLMKFLKILLIMLAVAFVFLGLLGYFVAMLLGIVFGVGAYFVSQQVLIEYEYLYLDREITIDKIMGQSRRKRVATYEIDRMEVMAPMNSYHLDDYRKREVKPRDCSSGIVEQPDTRYALYYEGNEVLIFEPNEDMVRAIMNVAPRKAFRD